MGEFWILQLGISSQYELRMILLRRSRCYKTANLLQQKVLLLSLTHETATAWCRFLLHCTLAPWALYGTFLRFLHTLEKVFQQAIWNYYLNLGSRKAIHKLIILMSVPTTLKQICLSYKRKVSVVGEIECNSDEWDDEASTFAFGTILFDAVLFIFAESCSW